MAREPQFADPWWLFRLKSLLALGLAHPNQVLPRQPHTRSAHSSLRTFPCFQVSGGSPSFTACYGLGVKQMTAAI